MVMAVKDAWNAWWEQLGHVGRCNRDPARTREAFEAGYLAALARQEKHAKPKSMPQAPSADDSSEGGGNLKKNQPT